MSLLDEIANAVGVSEAQRRLEQRRAALIQEIEEALDELGWSRKDLADAMGKKPSQVTRLLKRGTNPTLKTLAEVEAALDRELFTVNRNIKYKLRDRDLAEGQMVISQSSESGQELAGTARTFPEQVEEEEYAGSYKDVLKTLNLDSGDDSGTNQDN